MHGPDLVVLTQNIFGAGPRWNHRRERLAKRIASLRPDVIGLQEVHADSEGISQAHELAEQIGGYHVDYAPGRMKGGGGSEGVALLCRPWIRERSVEALSLDTFDRLDRSSQRVVLCGMLDINGIPLDVFVTHLSLSHRARLRTMRELLRFTTEERKRSQSVAALLVGDMNATPRQAPVRWLERAPESGQEVWLDAWKLANGDGGGATWPAWLPMRRIDYIFLQPRIRWDLSWCEKQPMGGSDHLGVAVRLRLRAVRT